MSSRHCSRHERVTQLVGVVGSQQAEEGARSDPLGPDLKAVGVFRVGDQPADEVVSIAPDLGVCLGLSSQVAGVGRGRLAGRRRLVLAVDAAGTGARQVGLGDGFAGKSCALRVTR